MDFQKITLSTTDYIGLGPHYIFISFPSSTDQGVESACDFLPAAENFQHSISSKVYNVRRIKSKYQNI